MSYKGKGWFRSALAYMIVVLCLLLTCCDADDDFHIDKRDSLRFSSEKVDFETLFATEPSVTKTLIVFNDSKHTQRIQSVRLKNGGSSLCRVNVDGEFLNDELKDIDIYGRDSLFVFAEITIDDLSNLSELAYADQLVFTLANGKQQIVPIAAKAVYGQIFRDECIIKNDTLFEATHPRVFKKPLTVAEGVALTLEAGTTLYFGTQSSMMINGTLVAKGTSDAPIVFRGDRLDNLFKNLPYDNTVGRWGGITFSPTSRDNILSYSDIHSGRYGINADRTDLKITCSTIHNVDGDALRLVQCNAQIENSQFSNAHNHCVALYGGTTEMLFCTIAQFFPWNSNRKSALLLADNLDGNDLPLSKALLRGCIVTGYGEDELQGSLNDVDGAEYKFEQCVLRTPIVEDANHYSLIAWELPKSDKASLQGHKQFAVFNTTDFVYDFSPISEESICVGVVDENLVGECPCDRNGAERVKPYAAGCYTIKQKEQ